MVTKFVYCVGTLAGVISAVYWLRAALVPVRDNVDVIVDDLQRIGELNAIGAGAACIAAVCGSFLFARQFLSSIHWLRRVQ
jgi:hypothetical protein